MKVFTFPKRPDWPEIIQRNLEEPSGLYKSVNEILQDVRKNGDKALREYTREFDGIELDHPVVDRDQIFQASVNVPEVLKLSIEKAKYNIEKFHSGQKCFDRLVETTPGVRCWQKSVPIDKIGIYVPGGSAPLFSTLLMIGVPAVLAGCREIVVCTPPGPDGRVDNTILFIAGMLGIEKIYRLGGAQAVAAMAYGTETVPGVYKIFGPGNQYVTAAKQLVSLDNVAIDIPAGPSEVAIIADHDADPVFVAADLIAQAEHGPDSQVMLFTMYSEIIEPVEKALKEQLRKLPRKEIAEKALEKSKIILLKDAESILEMVNDYAPEHLIIMTQNPHEYGDMVRNAGSVFLGPFSPESAGDYASGTNHTLPTNGMARAFSGVNLSSFYKKITFQEISKYGLFNLGPVIREMATAENLHGHVESVNLRLKTISKNYD